MTHKTSSLQGITMGPKRIDKTSKIIQWDVRGTKANLDKLTLIIKNLCSSVICLQETFLKENEKLNIRQHTICNQINKDTTRASGGISIIINNTQLQSQINLNTKLQAIAVSVTLHKTISICSLYIPPNSNIIELELEDLIQLLKPFILMGDFNSHNQIWGSRDTNKRGHTIENFMNKNNLCLLNNKSPTYLYLETGTYSVINLILSDPTIYLDYNWKTNEDNCKSDHYPIILERLEPKRKEKTYHTGTYKRPNENILRLCYVNLTPKANKTTTPISQKHF